MSAHDDYYFDLVNERLSLLDNLVEALSIEGHPHDLDRCDCLLCQTFKAAREHVRETEKGKA